MPKKILLILFVFFLLTESKVRGHLRPSVVYVPNTETISVIPTSTETPASPGELPIVSGPPCSIDWTIVVNADNHRAILSCYKALTQYAQSMGYTPNAPLCPPSGSEWELVFNSSVCWSINHGTPAALTATAIGPLPLYTPSPPAYPPAYP